MKSTTTAFCSETPETVADIVPVDIEDTCPAIQEFFRKDAEANDRFMDGRLRRFDWYENHRFAMSADLCIDGRVQDFPQVLGLPVGILDVFRSKGSMAKLTNPLYRQRFSKRMADIVSHGSVRDDMAGMHLATAHHSASMPDTDSCAAWKHQTEAALADVQQHCHELNFAWRGQVVAFPVLIDTDLDAMTIFGPGGNYPVERLVRRLRPHEPADPGGIVDALHQIFPSNWEPIAALPSACKDVFHTELAERIVANVDFIREVIALERPVELLKHNEQFIFVGRDADWTEEHNTLFLIDDTEGDEVLTSFVIALPYVAKNVILDAVAQEDYEWRIPCVVNIPYAERQQQEAYYHARTLGQRLRKTTKNLASTMSDFLRGPHGIPNGDIPDWMFRQMADLPERTEIVTSTSLDSTRLFVPFV
ncbi:hypothetical protein KJ925_04730 [Patescibacteria group bacterium]|nr:hypothetical protein [Patescibacteria group bacterium]